MSQYTRKSLKLNKHDVTGNIDRVIEYLTGVKKSLEAQGCIGIQFHLGHDFDDVVAEISMEERNDRN
jgi:hypothetical protein